MAENALKPRKVTVSTTLKFFGLDQGTSTGTELSVEYEVPDGLDGLELRKAMLREKERLDQMALACERLKGAVGETTYQARRATIKTGYDKVLGRTPDQANGSIA